MTQCMYCQCWAQVAGQVWGECRRFAPKPTVVRQPQTNPEMGFQAIWPVTLMDDACGEGMAYHPDGAMAQARREQYAKLQQELEKEEQAAQAEAADSAKKDGV